MSVTRGFSPTIGVLTALVAFPVLCAALWFFVCAGLFSVTPRDDSAPENLDGKKNAAADERDQRVAREREEPVAQVRDVNAQMPEQDGRIRVNDLCNSYLADNKAAHRKYRGQPVEWTGKVHAAEWSPSKEEGLFIVLDTGKKEFVVTAWFDKSHERDVLALQKTQTIRVIGYVGKVSVIKDRGEVSVALDDCIILESSAKEDEFPRHVPDLDSPEIIVDDDNSANRGRRDAARPVAREPSDGKQSESRAAARLNSAKSLWREGKKEEARKWLLRVVDEEPDTKAAKEARELLKKM
jgi:hypothetical protein